MRAVQPKAFIQHHPLAVSSTRSQPVQPCVSPPAHAEAVHSPTTITLNCAVRDEGQRERPPRDKRAGEEGQNKPSSPLRSPLRHPETHRKATLEELGLDLLRERVESDAASTRRTGSVWRHLARSLDAHALAVEASELDGVLHSSSSHRERGESKQATRSEREQLAGVERGDDGEDIEFARIVQCANVVYKGGASAQRAAQEETSGQR